MLIDDTPTGTKLTEIVERLVKEGQFQLWLPDKKTVDRVNYLLQAGIVQQDPNPLLFDLTRKGRSALGKGVEMVIGQQTERCRYNYKTKAVETNY